MNNKNKNESFSQYKFQGIGLTTYEKRRAGNNFKKYRARYHIENLSDLQLLEELVFRETIQERYKKKIEDLDKKNEDKDKIIIPKHILDALNDNLGQILILKEKLGLFEDKKQQDPFAYIQTLKKKFKIHREENKADYSIPCANCSEMMLLKFRTKFYDVVKHPWFKGKILTNRYLWKLYKEGKITKLDMVKVLLGEQSNSIDYIDWLENKLYLEDSK